LAVENTECREVKILGIKRETHARGQQIISGKKGNLSGSFIVLPCLLSTGRRIKLPAAVIIRAAIMVGRWDH
jgi:hypothetical protein